MGLSTKQQDTDSLLTSFWLNREAVLDADATARVRDYAATITDDMSVEAADILNRTLADDDVDLWVVGLCFFGHPDTIWKFIIDAMEVAETDDHLAKIAAGPVEHLLAHYGSLIPLFERMASRDPRFARMLTGAWRHRMSDDVWMRLRRLQATARDPLPTMIPLSKGVEYMAEEMSPEDRITPDKGLFRLGPDNKWHKSSD
jgi:hypothetical protein